MIYLTTIVFILVLLINLLFYIPLIIHIYVDKTFTKEEEIDKINMIIYACLHSDKGNSPTESIIKEEIDQLYKFIKLLEVR